MITHTKALEEAWPLFAPLPRPFTEHLLKRLNKRVPGKGLGEQIAWARHAIYTVLTPFARSGHLSSQLVLDFLTMHSPEKSPVGSQTFSDWHKKGVVRYREHGRPDAQNAAALIIARMIDDRQRNWLPSSMEASEPSWWCFRQDAPDAPILPCPVPLPTDLPPSALLWTPWEGAAWDSTWAPLDLFGAARWAGVTRTWREPVFSPKTLAAWDAGTTSVPAPRESSSDLSLLLFQAKATLTLLRVALAPHRLGGKTFYSSGFLPHADK